VLRGTKGGAFEITLVSPRPAPGHDWDAELASICDRAVFWDDDTDPSTLNRFRSLASSLPVSVALDRSPNARRSIAAELATRPDVVVFDYVHTTILAPDRLPMRSVVFAHNVENEIFARNAAFARNALHRAVWRSQHIKMKRFEQRALRRFDSVIAVSERDAAVFRDDLDLANVAVIPTAVDLDYYSSSATPAKGDLTGKGGRIVFTGSMDWHPNIDCLEWLLREAWASIVAASPRTRLTVVGRNPPQRLVAEASRRGADWTFTGLVDDVRPYVRAADISVIPLRTGGGTRLKIYEAMALGVPVVSTTVGAEGLPLVPGEHYLRADGAADFANTVVGLLRDAQLRQRIAAAARTFVATKFSPRIVGRAFEAICLGALPPSAQRSALAPPSGESAATMVEIEAGELS